MTPNHWRVVCGFKWPSDAPANKTELLWVEILRLLFNGQVPVPTFPFLQALRAVAQDAP